MSECFLQEKDILTKKKILCTAIWIFSFMAPFGVCIGLLITNVGDGNTMEKPIIILESGATGTFLYVTFLELVPHEFIGEVRGLYFAIRIRCIIFNLDT